MRCLGNYSQQSNFWGFFDEASCLSSHCKLLPIQVCADLFPEFVSLHGFLNLVCVHPLFFLIMQMLICSTCNWIELSVFFLDKGMQVSVYGKYFYSLLWLAVVNCHVGFPRCRHPFQMFQGMRSPQISGDEFFMASGAGVHVFWWGWDSLVLMDAGTGDFLPWMKCTR